MKWEENQRAVSQKSSEEECLGGERDQACRYESEECPWTCVVGSLRMTCPELFARELVSSRESQRGRIVKREYGPSRTFVVMGWSELEVDAAGEGERGRCIIVPMGMAQK